MNAIAKTTVVIVLIFILLAVLIAAGVASRHRAMMAHCQNNLRELGRLARQVLDGWKDPPPLDEDSEDSKKAREKWERDLKLAGRAFWHESFLYGYLDSNGGITFPNGNPYRCPLTGEAPVYRGVESMDYRGPGHPPLAMKEGVAMPTYGKNDIFAADRASNHRGLDEINVLLTDFTVPYGSQDTYLWIESRVADKRIESVPE